jgi:hypothetical protein
VGKDVLPRSVEDAFGEVFAGEVGDAFEEGAVSSDGVVEPRGVEVRILR